MHPTIRDQLAGLRAEIKRHREQTKRILDGIRQLNERRMGQRDPIAKLHAQSALNERLRIIRDHQILILELKAQAGTP